MISFLLFAFTISWMLPAQGTRLENNDGVLSVTSFDSISQSGQLLPVVELMSEGQMLENGFERNKEDTLTKLQDNPGFKI